MSSFLVFSAMLTSLLIGLGIFLKRLGWRRATTLR